MSQNECEQGDVDLYPGIRALVQFMKAEGVASFKHKDMEVHFAPHVFFPKVRPDPITSPEDLEKRRKQDEERDLYWSAGG